MPEAPIPKTPPANAPSAIQTQPPFVAFKPGDVPPAQAVYLQLNDAIFVRFLANAPFPSLNINFRYLTPTGEIKEGQKNIAASTAVQTITFGIGEAWLLSIVIVNQQNIQNGAWVFAQIGIVRGAFTGATLPFQGLLWQDYIYNFDVKGWPGPPAKDAWDGAGTPRSIVGTTQANGVDITEIVPANRRWQLIAFRAQFTTSATVANRVPLFVIDDGLNNLYQVAPNVAQPATATNTYNFAPGLPFYNDTFGNFDIPAPRMPILKAGYRIRTITTFIQATDFWNAPFYEILEWASYDA